MPWFIEAGLLHFFAFIVLVLAHSQRRAIRGNLKVIWPDSSWAEGYLGAYRVFVNFGWTYIDGLRTRLGQKVVTWEIDECRDLRETCAPRRARRSFPPPIRETTIWRRRCSRRSSGGTCTPCVRRSGRHFFRKSGARNWSATPGATSISRSTTTHPNSLLGIELARLLMEGELVAIQSDRVIGDVAAIEVPLANRSAKIRLPRGPMVLAALAKCPSYPLHVVRGRPSPLPRHHQGTPGGFAAGPGRAGP